MLFYNERKLLFSTVGHGFDKKIKEVSFFKNSVRNLLLWVVGGRQRIFLI